MFWNICFLGELVPFHKGSALSRGNCLFLQGTIMSLGRKSLNCHLEQLKPFFFLEEFPGEWSCLQRKGTLFAPKNMVALLGNLNLTPLGTWLFPRDQLKPFLTSKNCFHPFCSWMKKIIKEKVRTHDLYIVRGF
jgi:hypothetical protein